MNTWMTALQCIGFGVTCLGIGRHFEMSCTNWILIFTPLSFIFGCWLARDEGKVGL